MATVWKKDFLARLCSKTNSREPNALNVWSLGYPAFECYMYAKAKIS